MKIRNILVLAVLAVLVVSLAGCTSQQGTTNPTVNPTTNPGASPTPQPDIAGSSLFDAARVHMFEYKITSTEGGATTVMNVKYETSNEQHNGVAARHVVMTMKTPPGSETPMDMKYDYYVDLATKKVIDAHVTAKIGDMEMDMPVPIDQVQDNDMMLDAEGSDVTYAFAGIEPVTVQAGTFPLAAKYTGSAGGQTSTYWKDPLVPVPVKIASAGSTMELVAWS